MKSIDVAIIGGGCAGMAAALSAKEAGAENILVFERGARLGGVLRQCIHNGFGVHRFKTDMTGTEYARHYTERIKQSAIPYLTDTIVLDIGEDRVITACGKRDGIAQYRAGAVVLAMGARERPRGSLLIPGSRPAGVMTAGTAQRYMNIDGYNVGRNIVILGSGDIGLIMARQFTLEGAKVHAVAELMPYSSGLARNIVQCLDDFDIPIYYNTTVTHIEGEKRVSAVILTKVDENGRPKPETSRCVPCDTLILSVGLIPENELSASLGIPLCATTCGAVVDDSFQTLCPGLFACGNVLHVHDLVDFVSMEAEMAGKNAAMYALGRLPCGSGTVNVTEGRGVRGVVPQLVRMGTGGRRVRLQFRPDARYVDCKTVVHCGDQVIFSQKRRILTPGEMCEMEIERNAVTGSLTVQVEA